MKFAFVIVATLLVLGCSREESATATDTTTHTAIAVPDTTGTTAPPPTPTTTASETVAGAGGTLPPHAIVAPPSTTEPPPDRIPDPAWVARGQQVYVQHCAGCHGVDGAGKTAIGQRVPMRDLKGRQVQALTDDQIAQAILNGTGAMSQRAHRSREWTADEITALLTYIRALK